MPAPVQPKLGIVDSFTDFLGPIFGTNFPVYNAANVMVGHVNSVEDLAAGNINFLGAAYPPAQLQVVNFWGMLQPATEYLAAKGVAPAWTVAAYVPQAPTDQNPLDLLFQPASADQWGGSIDQAEQDFGQAVGNAANNLNPLNSVDWPTVAIYGGSALLAVMLVRKMVR